MTVFGSLSAEIYFFLFLRHFISISPVLNSDLVFFHLTLHLFHSSSWLSFGLSLTTWTIHLLPICAQIDGRRQLNVQVVVHLNGEVEEENGALYLTFPIKCLNIIIADWWRLVGPICAHAIQLHCMCVFMLAHPLHACMHEIVIETQWGYLPSHNKCKQKFGTLHHLTHLRHKHTYSRFQCNELSVPVRLGILVSREFSSLSAELNPGPLPPSALRESVRILCKQGNLHGNRTDRTREPKYSQDTRVYI